MPLNLTQIAAKLESVAGTPETLAAGDAFLAFASGEFDPKQETYKRNPFRETLSPLPAVMGRYSGKIPFMVELAGSSVAGTPPPWGKLLKPCAFGETIVTNTSAAYHPASASIPNLTLAAYMDGVIHKIWGASGNVKLNLEVGKPGLLHFDFQGAGFSQVDGAMLAGVTYSDVVPPAFQGVTFQIDGVDFWVEKVEFDLKNAIALRSGPGPASGYKAALITGREGQITLDPEMVLASTKDIWTMWQAGSVVTLNTVLGATPGNIVTIAANFQIQDVKFGNRTNIRTNPITALMPMSSGDDEFSITLT
jgi:hypothetical protein